MRKLRRDRQRFEGLTVGLDLHQKFIQYSVLDQRGDERANERIAARPEALHALLDELAAGGQPVQIALEASGCFYWVFDELSGWLGRDRVHVAAPSKVKIIAESREKDDASDAWWLAWLLHEGWLPEAFVAEGELRELRIACRELRTTIDQRSDLKRQMRSHLRQLGRSFGANDWHSIVGRRRIAALVEAVEASHGLRGEAIARLWQRIQQMDQEVEHWQRRVESLAATFDEVALLEEQLPGVGPTIAAAVFGELGDPSRYRSAKAYAKATGLTPGYRESGGRRSKEKKITRQGSAHVRWALTRAVLACLRCTQGPGLAIKRWVRRQQRRKPKKVAIVNAARKLAENIWRLFAST